MTSYFAAVRVQPASRRIPRPADGSLPECWLLAEWPPHADEAAGYWLSTLPEGTPLSSARIISTLRRTRTRLSCSRRFRATEPPSPSACCAEADSPAWSSICLICGPFRQGSCPTEDGRRVHDCRSVCVE